METTGGAFSGLPMTFLPHLLALVNAEAMVEGCVTVGVEEAKERSSALMSLNIRGKRCGLGQGQEQRDVRAVRKRWTGVWMARGW